MFSTCYPRPLPSQSATHLEAALTRQPPGLDARLCAPRRMPASAAVYHESPPALAALSMCKVTCQPPWVFPVAGTSVSPVTRPLPP